MKKLLLLPALFLTISATADTYGDVTVTDIVSVYDGDTFTITVKEWPTIIGYRIKIRLSGVDAPEIKGKCPEEIDAAKKAKEYAITALTTAKKVELRSMQRDKYFRILADVYVDDQNLSKLLIDNNLALPYGGKTKTNWCKLLKIAE